MRTLAIGFGPLGGAAHALFVRRTLDRIFDFRRDAVASIFARDLIGLEASRPGGRTEAWLA